MNKLIALPTMETLSNLQLLFSSSPFVVNWDRVALLMGSTEASIQPTDISYRALTGAVNVWYDSTTGRSNLLMPLIPSPEMADRHNEIGDAWGRDFIPYLLLVEDPILQRNRRAYINSIATRCVESPLMLEFHNELVVTDTNPVADQMDFYYDYSTRGQVPIQVFSE